MNAQLQLLFHADHVTFALVRELDDWRQEFNRLREALNFAKGEGARELPFFVLDNGELYSESLMSVEPKNRSFTIENEVQLAALVDSTLTKRARCRVFYDALQRIWGLSDPLWKDEVGEFAKEHGWQVNIHEPAGYGMVADFSKMF